MIARISQPKSVSNVIIYSTVQNISPLSVQKNGKECSYRLIPQISLEYSCQRRGEKNQIMQCDVNGSSENVSFFSFSILDLCNNQNDPDLERILTRFNETESKNIFKNIIKSFLKLIDQQKDEVQRQYYLDLVEHEGKYDSLRKMIKNKLNKKKFRWNYKVISLVRSKKYSRLFKHYLQNINSLWLETSKVERKLDHIYYSEFLIKAISDERLIKLITYYHTK